MHPRHLLPLIALAALSGCAASPNSIKAAYVSPMMFSTYSCPQLAEEEARLQNAKTEVFKAQKSARSTDTWSVALLGLPVGSFTGKNVSEQVAQVKGQLDAIHEAMIRKNCRSEMSKSEYKEARHEGKEEAKEVVSGIKRERK